MESLEPIEPHFFAIFHPVVPQPVRVGCEPHGQYCYNCRAGQRRLSCLRRCWYIFRMGNLSVAISAPPKRCDDRQRSDHPAMTIISSEDWPQCVGIGGRDQSESVAALNRNRWPPSSECADSAVMPQVSQQRGPATASRPGLQSGQLHADPGLAEGGGALVSDHAAGKAGEDRGQGRPPWSLCHFPIG